MFDLSTLSIAERFERASSDNFWVPPDIVHVVARPEIIYTHSARDIWLYNCVSYIRSRPETAQVLVDEVTQRHFGRASRWTLFSHAVQPELEVALRAAGYGPVQEMDLRAVPVNDFQPRSSADGIEVYRVQTHEQLCDSFRAINKAFGKPEPTLDEAHLERELALCTEPGCRVARYVAYDKASGDAAASAGLTLHRPLGVGFLWAGGTVPEFRGRGVYSALVAARARLARDENLTHIGLYAIVDTSSPIVAKQGFERLGGVSYWGRVSPS